MDYTTDIIKKNMSFDEVQSWAKTNRLGCNEDGSLYILNMTQTTNWNLRFLDGIIMEKNTNEPVVPSKPTLHKFNIYTSFRKEKLEKQGSTPDATTESVAPATTESVAPATTDSNAIAIESTKTRPTQHSFELFENQRVFKCYEGSMLRLYNYKDTWRLSTKSKIHASESKFTSARSFADLFWDVANLDLTKLNPEYCYTFILQHKENVNAYQLLDNNLILSSVHDKTWTRVGDTIEGVSSAEEVSFNSFEECAEAAHSLPFREVGYIVVDNSTNDSTIIHSNEYLEAQKQRGSGSNLRYRVLTTFLKGDPKKFIQYHPSAAKTFDSVEKSVDKLAEQTYYAYRSRYVFNKKFTVDRTIHMILKHLHKDYKESGDSHETRTPHNIESVLVKLKKYSPKRLNMALKSDGPAGRTPISP